MLPYHIIGILYVIQETRYTIWYIVEKATNIMFININKLHIFNFGMTHALYICKLPCSRAGE